MLSTTFMEYDCHIFLKYLVCQMKNLVLQCKSYYFEPWILIEILGVSNRNSEILGFSHLELEILGISSETPSIPKKM